nr:PRTRC system protein E [Stenotrophomonas pavanii]
MSLIHTLLPLLKNGSSINLNLKAVGEKIQIIIEPQLAKLDAETTDEVVATLQSVLVHPIRLMCERETTDQEFLAALTSIAPVHEAGSDQLAEYRQRLSDAAAEAKRKEADKNAAKTGKSAAKPVKAVTTPGSGLSAPADEGDEIAAGADVDGAEGSSDASPAPAPAVSPANTEFELF